MTSFDIIIDALPSGAINDLHETAERMVRQGYGRSVLIVADPGATYPAKFSIISRHYVLAIGVLMVQWN